MSGEKAGGRVGDGVDKVLRIVLSSDNTSGEVGFEDESEGVDEVWVRI